MAWQIFRLKTKVMEPFDQYQLQIDPTTAGIVFATKDEAAYHHEKHLASNGNRYVILEVFV